MSSRNRRFRRKDEDEADREGEEEGFGQPPSAILAARKAKEVSKKPSKKAAILSFQEEEGVSPVKAKETPTAFKSSVKPVKQKVRPNLSALSLSNDQDKATNTQRSAAGEYSLDKLKELKANAKSFQAPKAASRSNESKEEKRNGEFKLSGSFKPVLAKSNDRFDLPPSAASKSVANGQSLSNKDVAEALKQGKNSTKTVRFSEDDNNANVPSAELIRLAKEKRERLRSAHLAPDYVPLGGASLAELESRLKPEGGLNAERDEQSGSDDEDPDRRLKFVGSNRQTGLFSQARESEANGLEEEDDDDWVKEQIRKGVSSMATNDPPLPNSYPHGGYPQGNPQMMANMPIQSTQASAESIALNGTNALSKLQADLHRLQTTCDNVEKQSKKTDENIRNAVGAISEYEEQIEAAGQKYLTLQKIKAYIADLCDMLQVKSAVVEELQEHKFGAGKHRAAMYEQRTQEDESAEYEIASASASAAMNILGRGGDSIEAGQSASSAARHAEHSLAKSGGPQLDEFGRDISLEGNNSEAERKFRLQQRNDRMKGREDEIGGEVTTDESDTEERHYEREHKNVIETAQDVFRDADQEFSTLQAVKKRLEDWRRTYPEAYNQAHAPMSVPALFAPFVRNELLSWEPIFRDSKDFDRQKWYAILENFGVDQGQEGTNDDDFLIPKIVSDLICPIVKHAVQICWNPFSRSQTKRLVRLLDLLLVYLPVEDSTIQDLFKEATVKLEEAVPLVKLQPWPASALSVSPEASNYLAHIFGKLVRLVENISMFDKFLPRGTLQQMIFERLFQQQMSTYLTGDAHEKIVLAKRINRFTSALPGDWMKSGGPQNAVYFKESLKRLAMHFLSNKKNKQNSQTLRTLANSLSKVGLLDLSEKLRLTLH